MLIVFDWDGTLADSSSTIVINLNRAALEFGLPEARAEVIINGLGLSPHEQLKILFPGCDFDVNAFMARFREIHRAGLCPSLFPGIEELLGELFNKGYMLAVATAMGRSGLDWALDSNKIRKYFVTTICAEESAPKPNPQMLLDLSLNVNVPVAQMIMVGDTTYDMGMARSAKVAGIAVTYGSHLREHLQREDPGHIVDSVAELRQAIYDLSKNIR